MKIFFFLLICIPSVFSGQTLYYGASAGGVLSHISRQNNKDNFEYAPVVNMQVNGFIRYKTKGIFGISLEPGYVNKGTYIEFTKDNVNNHRLLLGYINCPFLIDFYWKKWSVSFGPEYSFLFNETVDYAHFSLPSYSYNRNELSGRVSLLYRLNDNLGLMLAGNRGLTSISTIYYTNEVGEVIGTGKEFNQFMQLSISYQFGKSLKS